MNRLCLWTAAAFLMVASPALAEQTAHDHSADHGGQLFYMFMAEGDWADTDRGSLVNWDIDGWYGGDINKFVLKSEGEHRGKEYEQAELWGLYSRNSADFWDLQMGVREDFVPVTRSYFTVGVEGMLPYFIDTQAHLFVSDLGDVSARVKANTDINISQRLIARPHTEINLYAQPVTEKNVKAGLADMESGLQIRYEIMREFAPYVDFVYERKIGATEALAQSNGREIEDFTIRTGLRFWFN